jgi:hypothetical protein
MAMSCRSRSSASVRVEKPRRGLRRSCVDMVPSGRSFDVTGDCELE